MRAGARLREDEQRIRKGGTECFGSGYSESWGGRVVTRSRGEEVAGGWQGTGLLRLRKIV